MSGERELNEIASVYEIAPNQIRRWKTDFLDNAVVVFDRNRDRKLWDELTVKQRESINWLKSRSAHYNDYNFRRIHSATDTILTYRYYPAQLYSMFEVSVSATLDSPA